MSKRIPFIIVVTLILIFSIEGFAVNAEESKVNRLINEKSPYLLQHAHNPVDWYPWGEEAFTKAKKEDKPIFLSIGYSTCHWCHVMENESFSKPDMAAILNANFVCIKVDREERPDLDNIYMTAVTALTGTGGWPMTLFLTPELKPFYGGTYFPPEDRWGRAGLKTVLLSIADAWQNRRPEIVMTSDGLVSLIQKQGLKSSKQTIVLSADTLKKAYQQFSQNYDVIHGGFGNAPKFPNGQALSFLLRYWKQTNDAKTLEMVEKTLAAMADGGMYDQIGGGFHRYSTDDKWFVPHFEKMLYDQAIISRAYLEAYQATGKEEYAQTAREILEYVLRDMTSPEGGFYSAEDADSALDSRNLNEKEEGAFYLWRKDELLAILGKEQVEIFSYYFGVEKKGNVLADPHGEFRGKNILYVAHGLNETARHFKMSLAETKIKITDSKDKLFQVRLKRPHPHLDDKILVDWNGLMIASLSFGSRVLREPRYALAAEKAVQFLLKQMRPEDGRLFRRYRDGEAAIPGMASDYAFLIYGLVDLYEATFHSDYLREAQRLTEGMLKLFWDEKDKGLFFTAKDVPRLLVRQKEIYDGPVPSVNSLAAVGLIRMGRLLFVKDFEDKAGRILDAFSEQIGRNPDVYPQALMALDFILGPSKEIVLSGGGNDKETKSMIDLIYKKFLPNKVVAYRPGEDQAAREVVRLIPFIENQRPMGRKTAAYVCVNHVCKIPTNDLGELDKILGP